MRTYCHFPRQLHLQPCRSVISAWSNYLPPPDTRHFPVVSQYSPSASPPSTIPVSGEAGRTTPRLSHRRRFVRACSELLGTFFTYPSPPCFLLLRCFYLSAYYFNACRWYEPYVGLRVYIRVEGWYMIITFLLLPFPEHFFIPFFWAKGTFSGEK